MTKRVEIIFKESVVSIDGQTKPGGDFHVREYEDDEWTGGCYATRDNLVEKLEEFFDEDSYYNTGIGLEN
jgi:hypothetical protein